MSVRSSLLTFAIIGSTMLYSSTAFARDAAVIPLYSPNVNSQKIGNITSLITSEVDFSGRYDMVSQADQRPKSLTPKCLKSVSCLKPIANGESVDAMITGSVTKMGGELEFFIILYENQKIIRMKRFRIEDSPLAVAADVGAYIQEVVTGKAVEEDDPMTNASLANDVLEEDDIFGGEEEDLLGDFSLDPEEEKATQEKAAEDLRKQEEAQRAQEQAEEERRIKEMKQMEEQARRLAMEAEAKRLSEADLGDKSEPEDDFDFNFAPSTVEVVDEDEQEQVNEEDDFDFGFDEPDPKPKKEAKPKKSEYKPSTSYSKPKSTRSKTSSSIGTGRIDAAATLAGKVGVGNFQTLNFVTYGGEVGIHLSDALSVHIGGEGYATNQAMPLLDEDGNPTDVLEQSWRVLIPVSLGVEYHFEGKIAKPYVGADLQVLPAYAGSGSGAAIGLRGRAGSNFMVADGFGLNLNVAFGFWNGQYFKQVPSPAGGTLNPSGLAPQVTVGPIIAF
jgi:hypothetical protein